MPESDKEFIKKMEKPKTNLGPLLIIIAACFWGSMGIFVRKLESFGFSAIQIVSIRLTLAALLFCLVQLIVDRSGFKIAPRDILLFLGLGFGSILFFTICYFFCNYHYAAFYCCNSFVYFANLDYADVGNFLS